MWSQKRPLKVVKNVQTEEKSSILIVDDSELNRAILSEILSPDYNIIEKENGEEALAFLKNNYQNLSAVLLDIIMPKVNGWDVLLHMKNMNWIENLPVIIISSESSTEMIRTAYNLGATDFINRPFDSEIVKRRVYNTIFLYARQRKLEKIVAEQMHENEKTKNTMIQILSHVVESRNAESGQHVNHISFLTKMFLNQLNVRTSEYHFTNDEISSISQAAALHDIGKIAIPDYIINKQGKLTDEEYALMKKHTIFGAEMIEKMPEYEKDPFLKIVHDICRHHHERFDGNGYPDGLVGNEIPLAAQIVSIADVYDALTSQRCYKPAFSHDKAVKMILNGECGVFNPLLLDCFINLAKELTIMDHPLEQ